MITLPQYDPLDVYIQIWGIMRREVSQRPRNTIKSMKPAINSTMSKNRQKSFDSGMSAQVMNRSSMLTADSLSRSRLFYASLFSKKILLLQISSKCPEELSNQFFLNTSTKHIFFFSFKF